MQFPNARARSASWLIAVCCGLAGGCATTRAGAALRVHVAPGAACPDAGVLADKLESLLDRRIEITDDEDDHGAAPADVTVTDTGTGYRVQLDGIQREYIDRARDCTERARVAAVFITLNEPAPRPQPPAADEPSEPAAADADSAARGRIGALVLAEAAYGGELSGVPGVGAGVWWDRRPLRLTFRASVLFGSQLALTERGGRADLLRMPLTWSASYLFEIGPVAFGPALGIGLDLLHFRGSGVDGARAQFRVNPGISAAVDAELTLTAALSAQLRAGIALFPREYDLSLAPGRPLGHTPRLWFGASLGLGWRFPG